MPEAVQRDIDVREYPRQARPSIEDHAFSGTESPIGRVLPGNIVGKARRCFPEVQALSKRGTQRRHIRTVEPDPREKGVHHPGGLAICMTRIRCSRRVVRRFGPRTDMTGFIPDPGPIGRDLLPLFEESSQKRGPLPVLLYAGYHVSVDVQHRRH